MFFWNIAFYSEWYVDLTILNMVHGCQRLIKARWLSVKGDYLSFMDVIFVSYVFKNSLHVRSNSANLVISANFNFVILLEQSEKNWEKTFAKSFSQRKGKWSETSYENLEIFYYILHLVLSIQVRWYSLLAIEIVYLLFETCNCCLQIYCRDFFLVYFSKNFFFYNFWELYLYFLYLLSV